MQSLRSLGAIGALAMALGFAPNKAEAQVLTPAGSSIDNTAQVTYSLGATSATATSNTVSVTVAEILDVVVTLQTTTPVPVTPGATQQAFVYRVTNTGNGPETFRLALNSVLGSDQFDPVPSSPSIYLDNDRNGLLSAPDTPYVVGSNDPVLAADADVMVLVFNDIPAAVVDGDKGFSSLTADARTGSGNPGTTFVGQGVNGTDAVVGNTRAIAAQTGEYKVSSVAIVAAKSQTIADQFGGTRPIPGATINYTIAVSATGSGTATAAVFTDNIPANTTYKVGTLRLNTVALTDGAVDDAGEFATAPAAHVTVRLGNLNVAAGTQTIQFAVTIN